MSDGNAPDGLIRAHILERILRDADQGPLRPLDVYLAAFPSCHEHVQEAYKQAQELCGPVVQDDAVEPGLQRVGDYDVIRELGRGGQGVVHLAHDPMLDRLVAIKLLHGAGRFSGHALQRFRREGIALARLRHRAICPVIAARVQDGSPYLVMQYVDGTSLATRLSTLRQRDQWPPLDQGRLKWACEILQQVAEALAHAHHHGVLHRDVTPGNIILDSEGAPHLIDFGLAAVLGSDESITRSSDQFGTLRYMPPEQRSASGDVDHRGDVYGVGVIFHDLLVGVPSHGRSPWSLSREAVLSAEGLTRTRRRDVWTVIERATDVDPDRRYSDANALARDLRALGEGRSVEACPVGPVERATRWAAARPRAAAALSFAGVLLIAGVVVAAIAMRRVGMATEELSESRAYAALNVYAAGIAAARDELDAGYAASAGLHLEACPKDLRGFEWRHLALLAGSHMGVRQLERGPLVDLLPHGDEYLAVASDGRIVMHGDGESPTWMRPPTEDARFVDSGTGLDGTVHLSWQEGPLLTVAVGRDNQPGGQRAVTLPPGIEVASTLWHGELGQVWFATASGSLFVWARDASDGVARIEFRHAGRTTGRMALSPDGRLVAVPYETSDHLASETCVFDARSRQLRARLREREHLVDVLAFLSHGPRLITAAHKQKGGAEVLVRIWDPIEGASLAAMTTSCDTPHAIAVSASGDVFLGGADGSIRRLDGGLTRELDVMHGHGGAVTALFAGPAGRLLSGSADGTVRVWNAQVPAGVVRAQVAPGMFRRLVLGGDEVLWCFSHDRTVTRLDTGTGVLLPPVDVGSFSDLLPSSSDGTGYQALSSSEWMERDVETGKASRIRSLQDDIAAEALRFVADDVAAAIGPGARLVVFDARGGFGQGRRLEGLSSRAIDVVTSADRSVHAALSIDGSYAVWGSRADVPALTGKAVAIADFELSPDGRLLGYLKDANTLVIRAVQEGALGSRGERVVTVDDGIAAFSFHPGGDRVAIGTMRGPRGNVSVVDVASGRRLLSLDGVGNVPTALAWGPRGDRLACIGVQGAVRVWRTATPVLGVGSKRVSPGAANPVVGLMNTGPLRVGALLAWPQHAHCRRFRYRAPVAAILGTPFRSRFLYRLGEWVGDAWALAWPEREDGRRWRGAAGVRLGSPGAVDLLRAADRVRRERLGEDYPDTTSAKFLALWYALEGQSEAARAVRESYPQVSGGESGALSAEIDLLLVMGGIDLHSEIRKAVESGEGVPAIDAGPPGVPDAASPRAAARRLIGAMEPGDEAVLAAATAVALTPGLPKGLYADVGRWLEHASRVAPTGDAAFVATVASLRTGDASGLATLRTLARVELPKGADADPLVFGHLVLAELNHGSAKNARRALARFVTLADQDGCRSDALLAGLRAEVHALVSK